MIKKGIIVLTLVGGFILFDAFVLDACIDGNGKSEDIVSLIETHCNCESVTMNSSSVGLTMTKNDGFILGNTYSFTIENCMFDNSQNLEEHLKKTISKDASVFKDIELIELIAKSDSGEERVIKIKNGKL